MIAIPPQLGLYAAGALAAVLAFNGAYFYGKSVGRKSEQAAHYAATVANVQAARAAEQQLWAARMAAEQERTHLAEESHRAATADISALHQALHALRARPVPVRIVRLLEPARGPGAMSDPPAGTGGVGAGATDPPGEPATEQADAVDAAALAAALRDNAGRCERNIARLNACIASYTAVREAAPPRQNASGAP